LLTPLFAIQHQVAFITLECINAGNIIVHAPKAGEDITGFIKKSRNAFVDMLGPLEDVARATDNAGFYNQVNALRQASGKSTRNLMEAQTDLAGHVVGKSARDILKPIKDSGKRKEFQEYVFHKHNIDRYREGKPVFGEKGYTAEQSKQVINELANGNPEFVKAGDEVVQYFKNLKQVQVDGGVMTKETADFLDEVYENYIPTYREVSKQVSALNNRIGVKNPKMAKGSERNILSLEEQMVMAEGYL